MKLSLFHSLTELRLPFVNSHYMIKPLQWSPHYYLHNWFLPKQIFGNYISRSPLVLPVDLLKISFLHSCNPIFYIFLRVRFSNLYSRVGRKTVYRLLDFYNVVHIRNNIQNLVICLVSFLSRMVYLHFNVSFLCDYFSRYSNLLTTSGIRDRSTVQL